ncbi:taste receptor type 1 member 3-like isoform X5 [Erpetoichthys calabaricus]|uniref:Taste receptor type 1 member 3-like n=1 Tax=Erpetoichthys calabaricus TaxID=27687 RepID=A0A8C4X995_ERPCA|nr:taste receptor type 1 member 3-like isoform X5 [Erpetoichthys calabaricus]
MQDVSTICLFLILGCFWRCQAQVNLPCVSEKDGDLYIVGMFEVCTAQGSIDQLMYTVFTALEYALNNTQNNYSGFKLGYKLYSSCGDCLDNYENDCYYNDNCPLDNLPVVLLFTQDSLNYLTNFGPGTLQIVVNGNGLQSFSPDLINFGQVVGSFFAVKNWTLVGTIYDACSEYIEFENQNSSDYCNDWKMVVSDFNAKTNEIKKNILRHTDNATLFFGTLKDFKGLITSVSGNTTRPFVYCCLESLEDLTYFSNILNHSMLLYHEIRLDDASYSFSKEVMKNITTSSEASSIIGGSANFNVTVTLQNNISDSRKYQLNWSGVMIGQIYTLVQILYKVANNTCYNNMQQCQMWTNTSQYLTQNETSQLPSSISTAINNEYDFKVCNIDAGKTYTNMNCYNVSQSPSSAVCVQSCKVSERSVMIGHCCMQCQPCSGGTFSNGTDCLPLTIVHEVLIYILSPLGILMCVGSLAVFLTRAKTPIVKMAGGNIFYCYLAGLVIAFSSSFVFAVTPTNNTCLIGLPLSAMGFSVCLSSILARSCRILIAFANKAQRPSKLQIHSYIIIITVGTLGEVAICLAWMLRDPLHFTYVPQAKQYTNMACDCNNKYWYYISYGYLGLLCLGSWGVAIKSNALPPAFSESRSISFSMLIFLAIWGCTILIIVSDIKDLQTVILGVSIALSSWGILGCITLPKVFVIIFRPERNSQQWIRHVTYEYCRHVAYKADMNLETEQSTISTSATTMSSVTS